MRNLGIVGAAATLAASGMGLASIGKAVGNHPGDRRPWRPSGFDPRINYHTGKPHEHKREIARRLRQAARRAL